MTLENIGEGRDALLCITNQSACCRPPYTGEMGTVLGNWYFPNGTVVFSIGVHSDIYRTRGQMVVLLHRRRGGEEGIYRCVIPDAMNVIQTIYIGVYSASTSEYTWFMYFLFNWWMLCACYSIKKFEVFGLSGLSYSLLFSTFKADQHKVWELQRSGTAPLMPTLMSTWRHARDSFSQAFPLRFCILQVIKNWRWEQPGNEAKYKIQ